MRNLLDAMGTGMLKAVESYRTNTEHPNASVAQIHSLQQNIQAIEERLAMMEEAINKIQHRQQITQEAVLMPPIQRQ